MLHSIYKIVNGVVNNIHLQIRQNIYMFHSILEFEQSWNFFHQLYNYSQKILYETQQNIYI
jgi:hypothetical protein